MTNTAHVLSEAQFQSLKRLDTCTVSNAIERFNVRLRNEGFMHASVACLFPHFAPMLGYAATATIRTFDQPMTGGWYYDRIDWWRYLHSVPAPRVLILQDLDHVPGFGAFLGEIHAHIATALGCVGCVTNGAVRDVGPVEALGFHLFAGGVSTSHAYAHVVEWGQPVDIGGLTINPGDLIHGDRHGIQTVPLAIAADVPQRARHLQQQERALIELCGSPHFSLDALNALFEQIRSPSHSITPTSTDEPPA